MAQKKLFTSPSGSPVLAVTWPFHELTTLREVSRIMEAKGYRVTVQKPKGAPCFELVISAKVAGDSAGTPEAQAQFHSNAELN